jgi:DNA-binding NarL/FixJ family response regulator
MSISLLIVDDHAIFRQGLRALLDAIPDFSILGEAGDGNEAIHLVEKLHPQVIILDLMMPGISGLEVTRRVCSQTRVVILSMFSAEAYVVEAFRSGACGYVLKDATASDLERAIRAAMDGQRYLSSPLSETSVDAYIERIHTTPLDPYKTLTSREREVLYLAAQGFNNQEISARLFISPRTVEIHRSNMMHKLGLHNQTELVRFAIKKGIVHLED